MGFRGGEERKVRKRPFEDSIIFLSWLYEVCWDIQSRLLKDFVDVWKHTLNFPCGWRDPQKFEERPVNKNPKRSNPLNLHTDPICSSRTVIGLFFASVPLASLWLMILYLFPSVH